MNHTGKDHPWFVDASASADSPFLNYYLFSQNPQTDIADGKIAMIPKGEYAAKEKLAAAVLLTAPGSPYIYYGEELGLYGTKEKGDEYVRGPMLWGDNYTTHYTDKTDATVTANIPDVTKQQADHQSVLNTYLTFTALRNTYPALGQGTMPRHAVFNESEEGEKKYSKKLIYPNT